MIQIKGSLLPGLAMSRSFGDKIGKDIGIISEPLINEYILNKDVKYIIMGSDGIWEFLSNEQVMNIGNKYYIIYIYKIEFHKNPIKNNYKKKKSIFIKKWTLILKLY